MPSGGQINYCKTLEESPDLRRLEVDQAARWKFLMFSGAFSAVLFINQMHDKQEVRRRGPDEESGAMTPAPPCILPRAC